MLRPTAVVELIWQDETGSTSATTVFAPSSLTVEQIDAKATALASIVASMTGCVLIKQRIKFIDATVPKPVPASSTPIIRTGAFFFSTNFAAPDGVILVPAIKDAILSDVEPLAGYGIDSDNIDVIAFENIVVAGGITNPFGDAFTALIAAYLQSRI